MRIWKVLAAVGGLAGVIGGVALAAWIVLTVSTVGPSTFNTGTAIGASDLRCADATCTSGKTANIWPAMLNATPGTRAEGVQCLCNDGATSLVYAIRSANTNPTLAAGLVARVTSTGAVNGTGAVCQFPTLNLDGTRAAVSQAEVYFGPLSGLQAGDPAVGVQAGDRTLTAKFTASTCEKLCFSVVLPGSAGAELASLANNTDILVHHHGQ